MSRKIKVVMCPAERAPYVCAISNSLENMQRVVGGDIEAVTIDDKCVLICAEEGRILDMPENQSCPFAGFVGDVFFCGPDGEEFGDLGDDQVREILRAAKQRWAERNSYERKHPT